MKPPNFTPSTFQPKFKAPEMVIPNYHGGPGSDIDSFSNYSGSMQSSFKESGFFPFGEEMSADRKHSYHSDMNYGQYMDPQADHL